MSVVKSRIWQVQAHQEWVKTVLIKLIVHDDDSVLQARLTHVFTFDLAFNGYLQLFCGSGADVGKWQRANVGGFIGVDSRDEVASIAYSITRINIIAQNINKAK